MIEDKEYNVELTIKVKTIERFSPIERERPLSESDAIESAKNSLFVEEMEQEFANLGFVMLPIIGIAMERK